MNGSAKEYQHVPRVLPDVAFDLLKFCRTASSRNISKLSRYALQAIVIPDFYTRKVGLLEGKSRASGVYFP